MGTPTEPSASAALAAWAAARVSGLNNRAAARQIGISERELIASACGSFATRLRPEFLTVLACLPALGEIKCIVRNPWAVLERAGVVHSLEPGDASRLRIQADRFEVDCELRLWDAGFALEEAGAQSRKLSLQFFTAAGISTAKFFLRQTDGIETFRALAQAYSAPDQSTQEEVVASTPAAYMPLERLVAARHDGLLRFLQAASASSTPLYLLVRNSAASLTTTKTIERVKRSDKGAWVNVLDDGLDLHLHEASLRYVRLGRDADNDAGWFHWFSDRRAVGLSVRVSEGWSELAEAAAALRV